MTVFVLRALGIGDLATSVPALRAVVAAHPGERVLVGVPRWVRPLALLVGGVEPVDVADLADAPRPGPVRVAVNLHGRGPQSHQLLRRLNPGYLVAYRNSEAGHDEGPGWCDDEHEVARWSRLTRWCGWPTDPNDLRLHTLPLPTGLADLTILHPGAKDPARRWPADRYADLARRLHRDGHRVAVTGSAADRALARQIVDVAGLPAGADLTGRYDVATVASMIADARLVVCADTGVAHLASAYSTPSVVIFGPMDPARWGPPARSVHRVVRADSHLTVDVTFDQVNAAVSAVELAPAPGFRQCTER